MCTPEPEARESANRCVTDYRCVIENPLKLADSGGTLLRG